MSYPAKPPGPLLILRRDYLALVSWLLPLLFILLYTILTLLGDDHAGLLLWVALTGTVVGLPVIAWRIRLITGHFRQGRLVTGYINRVSPYQGIMAVEFTYSVGELGYNGREILINTKRARRLTAAKETPLLVDPARPGRVVWRALFQ